MKKSHIITATLAVALAVAVPAVSHANTPQGRCIKNGKVVNCSPSKPSSPSKTGRTGGGGAVRLTYR
jgi:hypothetical protein